MKRNLLFLKARTLAVALLALVLSIPPAGAEETAQNPNARLNFTFQHTEVKTILEEIEKQSDYYFVYNHEQVDVRRSVSIRVENEPIDRVLRMLFEDTDVRYEVRGSQIALSPATHTTPGTQPAIPDTPRRQSEGALRDGSQVQHGGNPADFRHVTGRVLDRNGNPLVGASVVTPDFTIGVPTDAEGRFSIYIPRSVRTLNISMVGFETTEQIIPASDNMTVTMKDRIQTIAEVINTGYQTISQERSTGSASTVPEEAINGLDNSILTKLEGVVPGLFLYNGEYNIRGVATILNSNDQPLYVIDGFPSDNISSVSPRDIANVTVLKDAAAASIYGVRGANGVIVITTHSGRSGQLRIHANSSLRIDPIPDFQKGMNLMNTRELVDYQKTLFDLGSDYYVTDGRSKAPAAVDAMYAHKMGEISESEMNAILDRLRGYNNEQQVRDNLMQTSLTQQHAISASGGTETNRYYVSIDYLGNRGIAKGSKGNEVRVLFKEEADLAKWLTIDGTIATRLSDNRSDGNSYGRFFGNNAMPYDMLIDDNGELAKMLQMKSSAENERLISIGLEDESYNPITERERMYAKSEGTYLRLQGGLTIKPMTGLRVNISYQTERNNEHSRSYWQPNHENVRRLRNDATAQGVQNIPYGGIMSDTRYAERNYTFRVQANFDRMFGDKHYISALAGAERRSELRGSTNFYKLAYNDSGNTYETLDIKKLAAGINGEGLYRYTYNDYDGNQLYDGESRFVSFYGNAGYTYDNRYSATLSARVDDTNLFGTNPKYRYLPAWSAGLKWNITNEAFMSDVNVFNHLALRVTYGLTGNVFRGSGPFLIAQAANNGETGLLGTEVVSPPNESLRWEKTAVFNVGVDMSMLDNRLNASIEYYDRNTSDLLAVPTLDPTNFPSNIAGLKIMQNLGNLYNRGFEVSVNALAVKAGDFTWKSTLNFSYNVNKITKGNEDRNTILSLTGNNGLIVQGKPRDAIFSFRDAGLNPETGTIRVWQFLKGDPGAEDEEERNDRWVITDNPDGVGSLPSDDVASLVYSGSLRPKWTAGFINTFKWRGLGLSVHIIGNGGNIMLDPLPQIMSISSMSRNEDKRAMNFWRQPGDEKKKGVMPTPTFTTSDSQYSAMWYASDRHVMPGDFLKVRNISLTYELPNKWFGRKLFESAQLAFEVRNPFGWYRNRENIDPETLGYSISGLPTRSVITTRYMIGLDITF